MASLPPEDEHRVLVKKISSSSFLNKQLQHICSLNGLKTQGVKAELQRRLIDGTSSHYMHAKTVREKRRAGEGGQESRNEAPVPRMEVQLVATEMSSDYSMVMCPMLFNCRPTCGPPKSVQLPSCLPACLLLDVPLSTQAHTCPASIVFLQLTFFYSKRHQPGRWA